jgi:hypothetical protein
MLKNTEVAIKNGQFKLTGNMGTQDEEKQNKTKTQHTMC